MNREETLIDLLLDDVLAISKDIPGDQRSRRLLVRAIFAAIEGILWTLQQRLLDNAEHKFSEAECAALREVAYTISNNGQMQETGAKIPFKTRVKFMSRLLERVDPEAKIDFSTQGWQALDASIAVRDRLTHPKSREAMAISEKEISDAMTGLSWFLLHVSHNVDKGILAFLRTPEAKAQLYAKALRDFIIMPGNHDVDRSGS